MLHIQKHGGGSWWKEAIWNNGKQSTREKKNKDLVSFCRSIVFYFTEASVNRKRDNLEFPIGSPGYIILQYYLLIDLLIMMMRTSLLTVLGGKGEEKEKPALD